MPKSILVEVKLALSKRFPPGSSEVAFGRYRIQAIPTTSMAKGEAILSFTDTLSDSVGEGRNPEEETNIVCSLLSVIFDSRIEKSGIRINKVDIPVVESRGQQQYPQFFGVFDPNQVDNYLTRVLSLDEDLARQFIRACRAYSFALEFIPSDPTFAFFLLVVAGECLSSQDKVIPFSELEPNSNKCERFCRFVTSFVPDDYKGEDERNDKLFNELLRTVYYSHRSGFVHGGKEVSSAALMADKAKSSYFKHATEGKEIRTPGLGWFAKMIRGSLLGYLDSLRSLEADEELLSRLALEKAMLKLKAKKDLKQGQAVTIDDIEYR
jgi:hypothetical protein